MMVSIKQTMPMIAISLRIGEKDLWSLEWFNWVIFHLSAHRFTIYNISRAEIFDDQNCNCNAEWRSVDLYLRWKKRIFFVSALCVWEEEKRNISPRPWFGHTAKQKPTTNSRLHRENTKPPGHKMLLVTHIRTDYVALEKNNSDGYMYIYTKRRRQLFSVARSYVFVLAEVEERPCCIVNRVRIYVWRCVVAAGRQNKKSGGYLLLEIAIDSKCCLANRGILKSCN